MSVWVVWPRKKSFSQLSPDGLKMPRQEVSLQPGMSATRPPSDHVTSWLNAAATQTHMHARPSTHLSSSSSPHLCLLTAFFPICLSFKKLHAESDRPPPPSPAYAPVKNTAVPSNVVALHLQRKSTVKRDGKAQTNIQHAFSLQQAECISDLLKCCLPRALHTSPKKNKLLIGLKS